LPQIFHVSPSPILIFECCLRLYNSLKPCSIHLSRKMTVMSEKCNVALRFGYATEAISWCLSSLLVCVCVCVCVYVCAASFMKSQRFNGFISFYFQPFSFDSPPLLGLVVVHVTGRGPRIMLTQLVEPLISQRFVY
jgi:hypothetical protein